MTYRTGAAARAAVALGALIALIPSTLIAQDARIEAENESRTLTLQEALTTALDRSRELREARLAVEEADAMVSEARGYVLPRVELNASYTRNISPPASFFPAIFFDPNADPDELTRVSFGADNMWYSTLSFEQPLFEGRAFVAVGAAGRYRALQEETYRGRVLDVATRIRVLYYELLLAQEQSRLIARSVERVQQSLEETQALNRAGIASDYDVLRLEVELANLTPQLRRVSNSSRAKERELVTELDLGEGTRITLAGDLARIDLEDPTANDEVNLALLQLTGVTREEAEDEGAAESLYRSARESSSELRQLDLTEELRTAELRVEQAEFLPRVSLFGSYEVSAQQSGRPEFFGQGGMRGYGRMAGVQVSLPIFTGFQRGARMGQRRAAIRHVQAQREVANDRTRDQVQSLLEEVEEARMRSTGQRLAVSQARRGFEIASAQYREGLGSQMELTDAEVALRESEFNYAEAVFDYLSSRARLDDLVGRVPLPRGSWSGR